MKGLLGLGRHPFHALCDQMARVAGTFVRGSRLGDSADTARNVNQNEVYLVN